MKRITIFIATMFVCLAVFSQDPVKQKKQTKRKSDQTEHKMVDTTKVKKEKITMLKSQELEQEKATQKNEKSAVKDHDKVNSKKLKSKPKKKH
ncbi:MAG: hypothetical protein PF486_14105 [Prolixibacteraceae bacterium]|jgi:uncharacterized membrane protein YhiD involved in acid resistance|nr:hypothetical protein [Prolixibacteraceae bacterium]